LVTKYSKEIDFRNLDRNLDFIKTAAEHNSSISNKAFRSGTYEIDKCPICSSLGTIFLKEINKFLWNKCETCGHFFVSNLPTEISLIYEVGNEAQQTAYISDDLFIKRRKMISKPKAEFINSVVPSTDRKGLWVDIGCGVGELICEASALGWETIGFDADPNEVSFANKNGINVEQMYISENKVFNADFLKYLGKAKVVSAINVMEHIIDPVSWLDKVVGHLSNDTYIAIEVPREPSITSLCNIIGLPYKHMMTAGHYHIFTEDSMQIIQNKLKLEAIAKWCFGNGFVDLINTALWLSSAEIEESVLTTVLDKSQEVQKTIDEAGLSEAMIIITKK